MKKAILAVAMVMAMGSASAMADDVQGGQINFHGLVSATTCSKVVSTSRGDEATDGNVYLETAAPADITKAVQSASYGAKPQPFTIVLNCKDAAEVTAGTTVAQLTMTSSFSNTQGTLDNDKNLVTAGIAAADNVDIAIHDVTAKTQMKVDGSDAHSATFDENKIATYNFMASYVRDVEANEVTPGHVTTNAMYTFTYQ
ncbi:fimbrial protein [Salmonella enterica]|uniref:Fimbrial protein n=2 Tax=Salmonella enterica TaxID=28901 RepID=A0A6C7C8Z3_SALER|nr:fimbrial protein [Salmonella enterica]ECC1480531.1 fimbrial protein [Salmonella enterica subsp. salamae]ASG89508.1 fimbrial protein [Salmonella enterica subsp. salamae serovar 55:k:z39 str. 1315K]ECC1654742.1 fimbrial protein [Salmonella enterica subsp. salamae]ECD9413008.1 fimbrial protein [Salmonella enterica subsp. salamae]ECF5929989.1 fimbrial protein [Salmonella enterica subsp. salamae]